MFSVHEVSGSLETSLQCIDLKKTGQKTIAIDQIHGKATDHNGRDSDRSRNRPEHGGGAGGQRKGHDHPHRWQPGLLPPLQLVVAALALGAPARLLHAVDQRHCTLDIPAWRGGG